MLFFVFAVFKNNSGNKGMIILIIKLNIKDFDTLLFVVTLQEIWSQYVTANN